MIPADLQLLPTAKNLDPANFRDQYLRKVVRDLRNSHYVSEATRFVGPLASAIAVFSTQSEGREGERVLVGQDVCHAWKLDIKLVFSTCGSAAARHMCELSGVPLEYQFYSV